MNPDVIDLAKVFAGLDDYWSPRVVAVANGQYLKIARVKGELVWHAHADEDELFMVWRGVFGLRYRDGREVILRPGEVHVVPRGVEHLPFAREEALILFFEPATTRQRRNRANRGASAAASRPAPPTASAPRSVGRTPHRSARWPPGSENSSPPMYTDGTMKATSSRLSAKPSTRLGVSGEAPSIPKAPRP